ncbi:MAG TPA: hypothetical protein ENK78_05380 [Thiothrix sp.]|nr:hypothetical protein [Thiothrix sp.]
MPYRIFSLATLLIVIWLSYTNVQNYQRLINLQQQLAQQTTQAAEQHVQIMAGLDIAVKAVAEQQAASEQVNQIQAAMNQQQQFMRLQQTYATLLTIELKRTQPEQLAAITEQIAQSKEVIWQAGDQYAAHKAVLQGLMQPIDEAVQKWQSGNLEHSIQTVYETLGNVLQELNAG